MRPYMFAKLLSRLSVLESFISSLQAQSQPCVAKGAAVFPHRPSLLQVSTCGDPITSVEATFRIQFSNLTTTAPKADGRN